MEDLVFRRRWSWDWSWNWSWSCSFGFGEDWSWALDVVLHLGRKELEPPQLQVADQGTTGALGKHLGRDEVHDRGPGMKLMRAEAMKPVESWTMKEAGACKMM